MGIYITAAGAVNNFEASTENGCRNVVEPDYKNYITDPTTRRRMSKAVKAGVTAALLCLKSSGCQPDSIITASALGCLGDTEKFLKTIIQNNEQLLNPSPFIQSTFNTVGAQVAIATKNPSYNMTYVHRGTSLENALIDAVLQIKEGAANVLVGCYDEITETSHKVVERLKICDRGEIWGEGFHFFNLSEEESELQLIDVRTIFSGDMKIVITKLKMMLIDNNLECADIDTLLYAEDNDGLISSVFPCSNVINYKNIFGKYITASAAALWLAYESASNNLPQFSLGKNILIYNQFRNNHSFILLRKK